MQPTPTPSDLMLTFEDQNLFPGMQRQNRRERKTLVKNLWVFLIKQL